MRVIKMERLSGVNIRKGESFGVGFLLVLAFLAWFFRPWLHGIILGLYRYPITAYILILLIAAMLYGVKAKYTRTSKDKMVTSALGVLLVILIFVSFFTGALTNTALYREYHPKEVSSALALSTTNIRILPKATAYRYAVDTIEYARYTLGAPHLTIKSGSPVWAFYIVPDGAWNAIRLKDKGVLFVSMNTTRADIERVENELQVGPNMQIFDNLEWKIYKKHFLIDPDLPRVLHYEGKIYIVVPYISYRFRVFYTVPKWGGVIIIDEDGNIEDLKPEEALKDPRLKDFPLFPESLTRDIVEAQNYWMDSFLSNIKNLWLYHKNQIELIDVSNQGNRQPFLVIANDGRKYWMTAVEPYGRAHGLAAIYLMDAQSGEMTQVKFETPLTGPVKAIDYVKKALPTFDWSQFRAVEPIPVFLEGTLWWRIAIIPNTGSGVAKIAFVNAESKDVRIFEKEGDVKDFILTGRVKPSNETQTIEGVLKAKYSYIQNGNTHWILLIDNQTISTSAEDLSEELIYKLLILEEGDRVKIELKDGRVVEINVERG